MFRSTSFLHTPYHRHEDVYDRCVFLDHVICITGKLFVSLLTMAKGLDKVWPEISDSSLTEEVHTEPLIVSYT